MKEFAQQIQSCGFATIPSLLSVDFVSSAKAALIEAIDLETNYHRSKNHRDYGMVLLCAIYNRIFIDLLGNESLLNYFNEILGPGCIVYAYTSSSMPPQRGNYSTRIHVDCPRMIPNYITNMGATILLDEFTVDNGATWFLPNSQTTVTPPSEDEFFSKAQRVIAPAGSVWFFNARLWHAGGQNNTEFWRHALTLNMCRPYMKQRIDIPRALKNAGVDLSGVSEVALQKLGFRSQPPASYDEYYAEPEARTYTQAPE